MRKSEHELLKSVSRSFYLSIRFLPTAMREPVALGYLLARLTDTVADAPGLPLVRRIELLETLRIAVRDTDPQPGLAIGDFIENLAHPGERELLARCDDLFQWFTAQNFANREHLREVILTIIHGQTWDVTFFEPESFTACADREDLLRYTYWVAGSVGEFWTKIGFTNLGKRFADPDRAGDMLVNGRKLGQALQLTNILRDLHEDLPAGRCYLPAEGLRAAGWNGQSGPSTDELGPVFNEWLGTCRAFLESADPYAADVRDFRVRLCTRLPMLLAEKTVDRLAEAGISGVVRGKLKIPRSDVWKSLCRAAFL